MRSLRLLLTVALAFYMTGAARFAFAQETGTSPLSFSIDPVVQYAYVKGNVGNFEALNWMPSGSDEGFSNIAFTKDINKNVSLDIEGSVFPNSDNYDDEMVLKDGDLAFLKIDYKSFRKYFNAGGGTFPYAVSNKTIPIADQGSQGASPDLNMDINYFKLEGGIGEIADPFIDVVYEHNTKNGDKSLEQWENDYFSGTSTYRKLGPSWESVNSKTDIITLKEKKEFAGITFKGEQSAEVDYNNNIAYMQYLDGTTTANNQMDTNNDSPDAKMFGSGVRFEKWMLNDNTFAALGYHYNHIHDTDLMQTQVLYPETVSGVVTFVPQSESGWNFSQAMEDDHVFTGNFNTNLTPNLAFLADGKYEHMGSEGESQYFATNTTNISNNDNMENHNDQEGEHVALRYSGIAHTSLYAESALEQDRNWVDENYSVTNSTTADYLLNRIDRTQTESWTVGGRIVPNRFFIFSTQVKQHGEDSEYDTVTYSGPGASANGAILLDALKESGVDETSTLTWKPYHWLQNSLKYQFSDTLYRPQEEAEITKISEYNISQNHMLSSQFTYDISVQPIDPLLLMLTYSHDENYVKTLQADEPSPDTIPTFNSGDNSFLFSASFTPTEDLVWTNTVCYTISPNYVDYATGLPLGSDFRQTSFTTGLEWTFHHWLKIGPSYEYTSYKVDPVSGQGDYSANIFKLTGKFNW